MNRHRFLILILILLISPLTALAGQFSEPFDFILDQADPDEIVQGMIFLVDQFDARVHADQLSRSGASLAERHASVIIELQKTAQNSQPALLDKLSKQAAADIVRIRTFWITNAIELHAKKHVFESLVDRTDIQLIREIPVIELIDPVASAPSSKAPKGVENGVANSNAPQLWSAGIDGTGALVCDVDTGAEGTHPAFSSRWRGLETSVPSTEAWYDPVTSTTFPEEFAWSSHGTHTMGTILGDDGQGNQIGMAPGATWIAAGVIDRVNIETTLTDAYAAFQWAADPDGNPSTFDDVPDVISNSWGYRSSWGYPVCDDFYQPVIDAAEAAGAIVVFAAGNEGHSGLRLPGGRIDSALNVFSIGALNQDGTTIAGFSSRGPSECDNTTIKPEISAVGVDVRSSTAGGNYGSLSGTSMATPHVAGGVALLRSAFPEATPDHVKGALYNTAVDLGDAGDDNTFGMGRMDVMAAFNYLCANDYGDADGDTFLNPVCGGTDCDDTNENIYPGATEVCNGIDDNCANGPDEGGDALCDNGDFCDGDETCDGVNGCQADIIDPCPDDGQWCNGAETCDEATDTCGHADTPQTTCPDDGLWCNGVESCDESTDSCINEYDGATPRCPSDNLFCNGFESCDDQGDACISSGYPCEADEACDEDTDTCVAGADDDDDSGDDDDAADDDDSGDDDQSDDDSSGGDDDDDDSCGGC